MPVISPVGQQNPGLTMPTQSYQLQLADPFVALSDYTDITPFVKQWSGTVRGRQHELQLFQTGQVAITLEGNLSGGRFSPWNTNGPYYNLLSPTYLPNGSSGSGDDQVNIGLFAGTWIGTPSGDITVAVPPVVADVAGWSVAKITGQLQTTVASGSNGQQIGSLTSAKLYSATTTGFTSDAIWVFTSGGWALLNYTSITGGGSPTFNGITVSEGNPTWTVSTGAAVTQTGTSVGSGVWASGGTFTDRPYPVTAGKSYTAMMHFLTSVTTRACTAQIVWYDSSFNVLSTSSGTAVNDNTTTWNKATVTATAPANAAYAGLGFSIASIAQNEVHWLTRAALFNAVTNVPNTAWAPGQRGLAPARPIKATATWAGVTYPVWSMYVSNWTPTYGQVKAEQVINASDGLGFLAVAEFTGTVYDNLVTITDNAVDYWPCADPVGSGGALDTVLGPTTTSSGSSPVFGSVAPFYVSDDSSVQFPAVLGSSSYLVPPILSTALTSSGAFSVELWFKQTGLPTVSFERLWSFAQPFYSLDIETTGEVLANGQLSAPSYTPSPNICDGNWHHVVVTFPSANGATAYIYVDGVQKGTSNNSGGTVLPVSTGGFSFGNINSSSGDDSALNVFGVAIYNYALSAAQVANHYNIGSLGTIVQYSGQRIATILSAYQWPASLQNIATGISQVQAATASLTSTAVLSYIQTIYSTEMGAFFCDPSGIATFYDRHYILTAPLATASNGIFANDTNPAHYHYLSGIVPAEDDLDLWNDVPSQRQGGVVQRTQDLTSQAQYRTRTLTGYTGGLQTTDAENLAQSQWLIAHYSQPITRVRSITLSSVTDKGKNLGQMLGRGIFDNITVSWLPIDGSIVPFSQPSLIENITHKVNQAEWQTTWGLSPAETQPYLVLNDAVRGTLDSGNRYGY